MTSLIGSGSHHSHTRKCARKHGAGKADQMPRQAWVAHALTPVVSFSGWQEHREGSWGVQREWQMSSQNLSQAPAAASRNYSSGFQHKVIYYWAVGGFKHLCRASRRGSWCPTPREKLSLLYGMLVCSGQACPRQQSLVDQAH